MEITWLAGSDKLPEFLKHFQTALKVEKIGTNKCRVSTNITADLTGIGGLFLGCHIKKNFGKLLKGFVKDWKIYAETEQVSDAKRRKIFKLTEA